MMALLEAGAKRFDCEDEVFSLQDCSIRDLLEPDGLPETLFFGITSDRRERAEVFGFGREDIDRDFERLRIEMLRLARTAKCDVDTLVEAEYILPNLIWGLEELARRAKVGINPIEAANQSELAYFMACVGQEIEYKGPGDVNSYDAYQAASLELYQTCINSIDALNKISEAVREVVRISRGGPDRDPPTPSR